MKSNFNRVFFAAMAALGALVWAGCQTQYPASYPNGSSTGGLVINFESGLSVNPNLAEAGTPNNKVQTPGTAAVIFTASYGSGGYGILSPGVGGSNDCIHVSGSVTDTGNGAYPTAQLEIPIEGTNNLYNASLFSGVEFYLRVPNDDTAGTKSFEIPVAQTQPSSAGGTCDSSATSNACYNNFAVSYSDTNGAWLLVTENFSAFTRGDYGSAITPATLSGANLQQVLMLDWSEGNNNVPGTANVDFYVTQVQFY